MNMLITLFFCGDVMLGRGIDQILPQPVEPILHEPYVKDAKTYVKLAEEAGGAIRAPVGFDYVWGDALAELERAGAEIRIANLETAVTTSDDFWRGKGIHYRMHPANVPALSAAGIDCCVLANNHVLDWGYAGLAETVRTLDGAGIRPTGAGEDARKAAVPAVLASEHGRRVLVFAFGSPTSGVSPAWAATKTRPGVNYLSELSRAAVESAAATIKQHAGPGDIVVLSVHWGGNWGYDIPDHQIEFAHQLIDVAGVDVVHGHSSHHVKGLEVYQERLILYGCGDFINDYEGISGHEEYRADLSLMYLPTLDASGGLKRLRLVPMQMKRMRLNRAVGEDGQWLCDLVSRESGRFGVRVEIDPRGDLIVDWQ